MAQSSVKPQPVHLPGSELRKFLSEIMDQDLLIQVQLPIDYVSDGSRQYPAMYGTDGNRAFPLIANIATMLEFPSGKFPQLFVVGIACDIKEMSEWVAWRLCWNSTTNPNLRVCTHVFEGEWHVSACAASVIASEFSVLYERIWALYPSAPP